MSNTKNKIRLSKADFPVTFGFSISAKDEKVTLKYSGDWEDEVFYNFYIFLDSLSNYYRNRMDSVDDYEEKLNLCNGFLDTIQGYKIDLRDAIKDQEKFYKEIEFYTDQFNYYKIRFKEAGDLNVSKKTAPKTIYTTKQQILILEYVGALDILKKTKMNKESVQIIASIIGKDFDNTKKALANNHKPVLKGTSTKTKKNLEVVRDLFINNNLNNIANKVQEDINTIIKG